MANNKIAFGLCEQHNIKLPKNATPRDAWEALKKHGIDAGEHNNEKYYATNSLEPYKSSRRRMKNRLSNEEYARWCSVLASGLHGNHIYEENGIKCIRLDKVLIFSSGTFESPRIVSVKRFKSDEHASDFYNRMTKRRKKC